MKRIGITGQFGFVGSHLFNTLGLAPEKYSRVEFNRGYLDQPDKLDEFVSSCDVIVHLAAINRNPDPQFVYSENVRLASNLAESLKRTGSKAHVLFSSSTQEELDNLYGKAKKECRELLGNWAVESGGNFTGMVIPNVFGPFGKPFYNSFIATFCHQLTHELEPVVDKDSEVKLIYVGDLVAEIIALIDNLPVGTSGSVNKVDVAHRRQIKVSEILGLLLNFRDKYFKSGAVPALNDAFEVQLFNTYRSFIDFKNYYPFSYTKHTDPRGTFVELIRLEVGGQVSFSTTVPGITRGNHYHTRKIERFSVIKGKALIQLRRIGTDEVLNFELDGENPSFVDMPVWYTHNIKNIGDDVLYTNFWINEFYDPNDPDTFFETV